MARDRRGRNTIYDNDGTVIIQSTGDTNAVNDDVSVDTHSRMEAKARSNISRASNTVEMTDIFDTLVSYSPNRWFANEKDMSAGTCAVCGKETKSSIRKICGDCMDKYQAVIYQKAKEALANGERYINF